MVEFDQLKNEAGRHAFTMSPQKWIRETSAEEVELDKQIALSTLREKVVKNEITLAQASQLKNDIENSYGINNEMSSARHM